MSHPIDENGHRVGTKPPACSYPDGIPDGVGVSYNGGRCRKCTMVLIAAGHQEPGRLVRLKDPDVAAALGVLPGDVPAAQLAAFRWETLKLEGVPR